MILFCNDWTKIFNISIVHAFNNVSIIWWIRGTVDLFYRHEVGYHPAKLSQVNQRFEACLDQTHAGRSFVTVGISRCRTDAGKSKHVPSHHCFDLLLWLGANGTSAIYFLSSIMHRNATMNEKRRLLYALVYGFLLGRRDRESIFSHGLRDLCSIV